MLPPHNLKELRSVPGRLQPFISKVQTRCQSFSPQDTNFFWRPKHKEKGSPEERKERDGGFSGTREAKIDVRPRPAHSTKQSWTLKAALFLDAFFFHTPVMR